MGDQKINVDLVVQDTRHDVKIDQGTFDELDALGPEEKKELTALFQLILDLNGAASDVVSGQPKTYIDPKSYFQHVVPQMNDEHKAFTASQALLIEQALNFKALGGGKMGVLGAQLRSALRPYFSRTRECQRVVIVGTGMPQEVKQAVMDYKEALAKWTTLAAVISKNAKSFAAQAGINLYTKMHHWDAKNQKEWTALLAAMGVVDQIEGDDLRPLVYLALHPLPLMISSRFRKAAAGVEQKFVYPGRITGDDEEELVIASTGFVNSVCIRARATPAGCSAFAVTAAAWPSLGAEAYSAKLKEYIRNAGQMTFEEYQAVVTDVKQNGEQYHPMAREFGVEVKVLDTSRCNLYMNIAAAYIYETLKGTLARSAALQKYKDQNTRVINVWQTRFRMEKGAERDSVSAFLNATEKKDLPPAAKLALIKSDTDILEAEMDYAKLKLKKMERIREVAGDGAVAAEFVPPSLRDA